MDPVFRKLKVYIWKVQQGYFSKIPCFRLIKFIAVSIGLILLFLVYWRFTWSSFIDNIGFCTQLFCDFIDYYYPMGDAIFYNSQPVEGFLYSPLIAIFLAIFPPLGLDLSLVIWGILQVVAIILYFLIFYHLVPSKFTNQLIFIVLILFSYPVWLNFLAGNTGMFITAALFGSLLAFERDRFTIAIILLVLAGSFKFYPIILIAPFVLKTSKRFILLSIGTIFLMLFIIPGLVIGIDGTTQFYNGLLLSFQESDWVVKNPHSQFFPHIVLRLIGSESEILLMVLKVFSFCLAVVNLLFIYFVKRSKAPYANIWCFQIVLLSIPFMLKTSWPIDFIYLPFVQSFLIWRILNCDYSYRKK